MAKRTEQRTAILEALRTSPAPQTAQELHERLPEVGPSFRDTTRVAGANPAIWGDIFATNREAVARVADALRVLHVELDAFLRRESNGQRAL